MVLLASAESALAKDITWRGVWTHQVRGSPPAGQVPDSGQNGTKAGQKSRCAVMSSTSSARTQLASSCFPNTCADCVETRMVKAKADGKECSGQRGGGP